jgi:hypothetical protein
MGAIHFSIDTALLQQLQQLLPLKIFVETGTFRGDSVIRARPFFERLYSVESIRENYQAAADRIGGDDAVHLHCGDSVEFLKGFAPSLADESVLYWLDAHWCSTEAAGHDQGAAPQCVLLEELAAIASLNPRSIVLIDDARYFMGPPPPPNDMRQWPTFDEVLRGLRALSSDHEVAVADDVVIFSPRSIGPELRAFLGRHQADLLAVLQDSRESRQKLTEAMAANAAKQERVDVLQKDLDECDADRSARLELIHELQDRLDASEADRAARLEVIEALHARLEASRADLAAKIEIVDALQAQLRGWETDRLAGFARRVSARLKRLTGEKDRGSS